MAQTVLLTLGRLPKALTLARAFKAQGWRVIVADPFKWHVARPSRAVDVTLEVPSPNSAPSAFRAAILGAVDQYAVNVVLPVSEESWHVLALAADLPDGVTLLGPTSALYRQLQDKQAFVERGASLGLNVPETYSATTGSAQALAASCPTVIKPRRGCSGIGVRYLARGNLPEDITDNDLLQRRVDGEPLSTLSIMVAGKLLDTVTYRGRVFSGSVAICFERMATSQAIHQWISTFVSGLDYTGFIAFDFIVDSHGLPWAIECNPRATSGVHFYTERSLGSVLTGQSTALSKVGWSTQQWSYSTLTEVWSAVLSGHWQTARERLAYLFSAADVVWRLTDPLPYLLMTPMSWEILWPAMREGISLGEASQRDIAPLFSAATDQTLREVAHEV